MSVLLVAAKKDKINEITELIRGAGLIPVVVDVDAFAIENMYSVNHDSQPEEIVALVNIGSSIMNINILKGTTSLFTRDISVGGSGYSEAIQRELGVSYEEAEFIKKGQSHDGQNEAAVSNVLEGVNAEVASEIAKSIDYFKTTSAEGELKKILLCGGCAKVAGLARQLGDRMGRLVELANPFNNIDTTAAELAGESLSDFAPMVAVGVGLAIRSIGDRLIKINLLLRPRAKTVKRQWDIRLEIACALAIVMLAIGACLYYADLLNEQIEARQAEKQDKEKQLTLLKEKVKQVQDFEQKKKLLEDKNRVMDELEKSRAGPVRVLDYVSQSLNPLNLWLTRLSVKGSEVELEGRALTNDDVVDSSTIFATLTTSGTFGWSSHVPEQKLRSMCINSG